MFNLKENGLVIAEKELVSNEPGKRTISLTDKEYQALQTVYDNYNPDKHSLEYIRACDGFAAFCEANGRASFIYSVDDEKPSFVNIPDEAARSIWVEKIADHWYYACQQG